MNNYLDLQDIDTDIQIEVKLSTIGLPDFIVTVADHHWNNQSNIIVNHKLLSTFNIDIELRNKHYTLEHETAVIIDSISIDHINIIPTYNHLANYQNDHHNNTPTSYLGFNGKWTLTFDRPFYQWLHQAQGQGWLLS
jgi:hypothetical protein